MLREEVLKHGFALSDIVSEANPVTWAEYLANGDHPIMLACGSTLLYMSHYCCNWHGVVHNGRIYQAYGYHGLNLFNLIAESTIPQAWYKHREGAIAYNDRP